MILKSWALWLSHDVKVKIEASASQKVCNLVKAGKLRSRLLQRPQRLKVAPFEIRTTDLLHSEDSKSFTKESLYNRQAKNSPRTGLCLWGHLTYKNKSVLFIL